jgi:hypothetical protein
LQLDDVEVSFSQHLSVIKEAYCHPKKVINFDVWVLEVLLTTSVEIQHFKLVMK